MSKTRSKERERERVKSARRRANPVLRAKLASYKKACHLRRMGTVLGRMSFLLTSSKVQAKHGNYTPCDATPEQLALTLTPNCQICGRHESVVGGLSLDHDHQTGKFRGWLCGSCNNGLGRFFDSPATLRLAIAYLEVGHDGV